MFCGRVNAQLGQKRQKLLHQDQLETSEHIKGQTIVPSVKARSKSITPHRVQRKQNDLGIEIEQNFHNLVSDLVDVDSEAIKISMASPVHALPGRRIGLDSILLSPDSQNHQLTGKFLAFEQPRATTRIIPAQLQTGDDSSLEQSTGYAANLKTSPGAIYQTRETEGSGAAVNNRLIQNNFDLRSGQSALMQQRTAKPFQVVGVTAVIPSQKESNLRSAAHPRRNVNGSARESALSHILRGTNTIDDSVAQAFASNEPPQDGNESSMKSTLDADLSYRLKQIANVKDAKQGIDEACYDLVTNTNSGIQDVRTFGNNKYSGGQNTLDGITTQGITTGHVTPIEDTSLNNTTRHEKFKSFSQKRKKNFMTPNNHQFNFNQIPTSIRDRKHSYVLQQRLNDFEAYPAQSALLGQRLLTKHVKETAIMPRIIQRGQVSQIHGQNEHERFASTAKRGKTSGSFQLPVPMHSEINGFLQSKVTKDSDDKSSITFEDQNFLSNLSDNRSALLAGNKIQQKMALDRMVEQKRNMKRAMNKTDNFFGERKLQELDAKDFVQFLNRDVKRKIIEGVEVAGDKIMIQTERAKEKDNLMLGTEMKQLMPLRHTDQDMSQIDSPTTSNQVGTKETQFNKDSNGQYFAERLRNVEFDQGMSNYDVVLNIGSQQRRHENSQPKKALLSTVTTSLDPRSKDQTLFLNKQAQTRPLSKLEVDYIQLSSEKQGINIFHKRTSNFEKISFSDQSSDLPESSLFGQKGSTYTAHPQYPLERLNSDYGIKAGSIDDGRDSGNQSQHVSRSRNKHINQDHQAQGPRERAVQANFTFQGQNTNPLSINASRGVSVNAREAEIPVHSQVSTAERNGRGLPKTRQVLRAASTQKTKVTFTNKKQNALSSIGSPRIRRAVGRETQEYNLQPRPATEDISERGELESIASQTKLVNVELINVNTNLVAKEDAFRFKQQAEEISSNRVFEVIHNNQKDIKIMKQICERLVGNVDTFPTLKLGEARPIEITAGETLYFRVEIEGSCSPLKVFVESETDFQVALSTKSPNPTPRDCEFIIRDEMKTFVSANSIGTTSRQGSNQDPFDVCGMKTTENFLDSFLYMGFFSYLGGSLTATVTAKVPRSNEMKEKLMRHKEERDRMYSELHTYFTPADPYYRAMLAMDAKRRAVAGKHRTQLRELGPAKLYFKDEEATRERFFQSKVHAGVTLKRKEARDKSEQQRKYFLLYKWAILNNLKSTSFFDNDERHRTRLYVSNFIKRLQLRRMLKTLYVNFRGIQRRNHRAGVASFLAVLLSARLKRRVTLRGTTYEGRMQAEIAHCVSLAGLTLHEQGSGLARSVLLSFLRDAQQSEKMRSAFTRLAWQLRKFVSTLAENFEFGRQKEHTLRDLVWKNEHFKVAEALARSKAFTEKYGDVWAQVSRCETALVERLQGYYIRRQKLAARAQFNLEWIHRKKQAPVAEADGEIAKEKAQQEAQYAAQLVRLGEELGLLEEFLYRGVENVLFKPTKKDGYYVTTRELEAASQPALRKRLTQTLQAAVVKAGTVAELTAALGRIVQSSRIVAPKWSLVPPGRAAADCIKRLVLRTATLTAMECTELDNSIYKVYSGEPQVPTPHSEDVAGQVGQGQKQREGRSQSGTHSPSLAASESHEDNLGSTRRRRAIDLGIIK